MREGPKVILPVTPDDPEKAQISVDKEDDLYNEIRLESVLTDEKSKERGLSPETQVEVTIESNEEKLPKES